MISWTRRLLPLTQICYNAAMRQCSSVNVVSEMKEILRIASTGDLKTALSRHEAFRETNDVPDWGVVKLSSVLLANGLEHESERLLKQHYEETGGIHRFARKSVIQEEQVVAALLRVINCTNGDGLERAHRLYRWLLEGRFCSNKDVFIVLFVERALQRNGIAAAVAELEQLKKLGRVKSLTRTFHCLLHSAMDHGKEEELAKVENTILTTSPSALQNLKRFVSLELGKNAAFVESLGQDPCLESSQLRFIVELAAKLKKVVVLESLIELSRLLQFRPQDKAMIYDELVKIYGKHEDKDNLERIAEFVLRESEREHFAATLGRLAHFYRCCHLELPNRLLRAL
ncbi:hypothetical protein V3C99_016961 [Haemonchus contortus]